MNDTLDLATLIGRRFVLRRDVYAVQRHDGSYAPVRSRIEKAHISAHLAGTTTYGHYMVTPEGNTNLLAFDIDLRKNTPAFTGSYRVMDGSDGQTEPLECNPREAWLDRHHPAFPWLKVQLRSVGELLARRIESELGLPVAVAYSGGKGLHVYGFTGPVPAAAAREAAMTVLRMRNSFEPARGNNFWQATNGEYANLDVEVYPKQDNLDGKDLGNLMRLPLGVNQKTGQRGFFMDLAVGYDTFKPMDPVVALQGILP